MSCGDGKTGVNELGWSMEEAEVIPYIQRPRKAFGGSGTGSCTLYRPEIQAFERALVATLSTVQV